MFNWLIGNNHVDTAMRLFYDVYYSEISRGYSSEVAELSAKAAAASYMAQYHGFKEQGL